MISIIIELYMANTERSMFSVQMNICEAQGKIQEREAGIWVGPDV